MTQFYGVTVDSKTGKSFRQVNLPETHAAATQEVKQRAKQLGHEFQYILPLSSKQGSTLTKHRDYRRRAGQL